MPGRVTASVRVTVTLEIDVLDSWGNDCTVEQIQKQARDSAIGVCRGKTYELYEYFRNNRARVIGDPKVQAVFTEIP